MNDRMVRAILVDPEWLAEFVKQRLKPWFDGKKDYDHQVRQVAILCFNSSLEGEMYGSMARCRKNYAFPLLNVLLSDSKTKGPKGRLRNDLWIAFEDELEEILKENGLKLIKEADRGDGMIVRAA